MLREPFNLELACFGESRHGTLPGCNSCPLKEPCSKSPALVPVCDFDFDFMPSALAPVSWSVSDQIFADYANCYLTVFGQHSNPDSPSRIANFCDLVSAAADNLGMSVRLFFLANMLGHAISHGVTAKFYGTSLIGIAAARRAQTYKDQVCQSYGQFDEKLLLAESSRQSEDSVYVAVKDGEEIAGRWITGFLRYRSDKPIGSFLNDCEHKLPDAWLATDYHYSHFLASWVREAERSGTPAQKKKRANVASLTGQLKRHSQQARVAYIAKSQAVRETIPGVIAAFDIDPRSLFVKANSRWNGTLSFWAELGLALQHITISRAAKKDRRAMQKLVKPQIPTV